MIKLDQEKKVLVVGNNLMQLREIEDGKFLEGTIDGLIDSKTAITLIKIDATLSLLQSIVQAISKQSEDETTEDGKEALKKVLDNLIIVLSEVSEDYDKVFKEGVFDKLEITLEEINEVGLNIGVDSYTNQIIFIKEVK